MKTATQIVAQAYLELLQLSRNNGSTYVPDSVLAALRDQLVALSKADTEFAQISFEFVADMLRGR